jgi:MFS family permease
MITYAFPLRQRPAVSGAIATLSVGATVLGPPLGGLFVTKSSWRWCFAINPIIGVPTFVASAAILRVVKLPVRKPERFSTKVKRLDWLGLAVLLPSIVCLLLAMQWGGTQFPWSSARIIVLLVLSALLMVSFLLTQWKQEEDAMLPLRILRQRTVATSAAYGFAVVAGGETLSYYVGIPLSVYSFAKLTNFSRHPPGFKQSKASMHYNQV